jgi:glyoxylase-like metal-dependent hydrolase (beta-lactamase superfamily II)
VTAIDATIDLLDLGSSQAPQSMLARGGAATVVPTRVQAFLIRSPGARPVLVDTGFRDNATMAASGFESAPRLAEQGLAYQLARFGLGAGDIGAVLVTHLHIDHGGQLYLFPMSTPVIVMRREVEVAIAGSHGHAFGGLGEVYPAVDMQHVFDRVYTPGALAMLDLELTGPVEVWPGITCEATGGHTEGSMSVRVATAEGSAVICGDLIYNVAASLIERRGKLDALEPSLSQQFTVSGRQETAAMVRALSGTRFLLPAHDRPAVLAGGRVVGRIDGDRVPGPVTDLAGEQAR